MSLIVFDMGRRVETPVQPEKFRVKATPSTDATGAVHAGHADISAATIAGRYGLHEKAPDSIAFAGDIMTRRVLTLDEDATVADAEKMLADSGFHHLPVTSGDGRILAILSDRDLLRALLKRGDIRHHKVTQYASRPVLCVHKGTDIRQTSNILYQYNIGALPVIDDNQLLSGIITRSDILKLLSHYGPMELWA